MNPSLFESCHNYFRRLIPDLESIIRLAMPPTPLILSPASPTDLVTSIIKHETHPTTLVICATRAEFLASLADDIQHPAATAANHPDDPDKPSAATTANTLLANPLYQVAVARHIRMAFVPTVSHLRAYLSVFSPSDSRIPPPPIVAGEPKVTARRQQQQQQQPPLLVVYGFLGLHRDTSEWSAQGIGATAAALVEAGRRCGFGVVSVDAPRAAGAPEHGEGEEAAAADESRGEGAAVEEGVPETSILDEELPVLSTSVVRAGGDLDDAVWTSRKVTLERVLGRWFQYKEGDWAKEDMTILADA